MKNNKSLSNRRDRYGLNLSMVNMDTRGHFMPMGIVTKSKNLPGEGKQAKSANPDGGGWK